MCWLKDIFKASDKEVELPGMERPSPNDWIENDSLADVLLSGFYRDDQYQLRIHKEFLIPKLEQDPYATPLGVEDTGSMEPVIDVEGQCIGIWGAIPQDQAKLNNHLVSGDIAVYLKSNGQIIMHRIKQITEQRNFVFLGDNNQGIVDPGFVSEGQIRYIIIGTIY